MKKRIIILTRSAKYGKICVAGIVPETGEWIRLVSTDEASHGGLSGFDLDCTNGHRADLLDIIDVEVLGKDNNPVQPENYIIDRSVHPEFVKSVFIEEVIGFQEDKEPFILGNRFHYVDERTALLLACSLTLAVVDNLQFEQTINPLGQKKMKLMFTYKGHLYSNMPVTDPRYFDVENGLTMERAAIVVSMGNPYNDKYYKYVSAIYPLNKDMLR